MSQQSVRQEARRSALDAQAARRKERADRERRLEGLGRRADRIGGTRRGGQGCGKACRGGTAGDERRGRSETLSPRSSRQTGDSISRWHDPSRFRRVHATRLLESSGCRREHVLIGHGDSFHVTRLGLDRIAAARQARLAGQDDLCGGVELFTIVSVGGLPGCRVTASQRHQRRPGAHRPRDDVKLPRGCGGVGFVADERFVGGGVGDTVETVGRHFGHVVLLLLPSSSVPGVCGENDERLTVEVGQGRRLLHRPVPLEETLR